MAELRHDQLTDSKQALLQKIDAVGWGIFLIWMGVAFLANISWGIGLIGVGIIIVGGQVARKYFALPVERFWMIIGIVFLAWGVVELLSIQYGAGVLIPGGVLPILFIVAGIALVVSGLFRKSQH